MKKKVVIILAALIACMTALIWFFSPSPIIDSKDIPNCKIGLIRVNIGGAELIQINDYNKEKILNYLSTCQERRWIFADDLKYHSMDDMKIEIILHYGSGSKHIILGNVNYIMGMGPLKYKVLNSKEVTQTLLQMLDY